MNGRQNFFKWINLRGRGDIVRLHIVGLLALSFTISSCDGDGVSDEGTDERLLREAMCVVASERFQLYDEAEKHRKHGIDVDRIQSKKSGTSKGFTKMIHQVRPHLNENSKEFNATFLEMYCDKTITVGELESV